MTDEDFKTKTLLEAQQLIADFGNLNRDELRMLMYLCDYVKGMCGEVLSN